MGAEGPKGFFTDYLENANVPNNRETANGCPGLFS